MPQNNGSVPERQPARRRATDVSWQRRSRDLCYIAAAIRSIAFFRLACELA